MSGKIYYVLPERARPVGGVNVILEQVAVLQDEGYAVFPLVGSPDFRYAFGYGEGSMNLGYRFDPRLATVERGGVRVRRVPQSNGVIGRARKALSKVIGIRGAMPAPRNRFAQPGRQDVVVVPEFWAPQIIPLFPESTLVLLVQGPSELLIAKPVQNALHEHFSLTLVTSVAARRFAQRLDLPNILTTPLSVNPTGGLNFVETKKKQVSFMPRKRPKEVEVVIALLKKVPALQPYVFVPIVDMSRQEVEKALRESLLFISFSQEEGFGLPPAEAMSAGCIVVGYVGVGGREYFDDQSGIVVPDSDFVGLIDAVERVAIEYDRDPIRLDALRRLASDRIASYYSRASARAKLLLAWQNILEQSNCGQTDFRAE